MKIHYIINVYILTDRQGEWWQTLKTDGTTRRFVPGTANFLRDKEFKDQKSARRWAEKKGIKRFQILKLTPPIPPSRTWDQEIVYETQTIEAEILI